MNSKSSWEKVVRASLQALRLSGPKGSLVRRLELEAELQEVEGSAVDALAAILEDKREPAREFLLLQLSTWDADASPDWSAALPNTRERREDIYKLLKLESIRDVFERHVPPKLNIEHATVISGDSDGRWYSEEFVLDREFYWPHYRGYLAKKGWSEQSLQLLHQSSSRVLEHLAPPHSPAASPRRGLVVGYVQSGKTSHFSAVVAKAVDAGFRLVIVLAGTIDLLREQTQRRLDMELVGKENILKDQTGEEEEREYRHDAAWDKFASYGRRPRELGYPDIKRLTNSRGDFRAVGASFSALQYDEVDPLAGKAWHPENIRRSNARLIVIKKNTNRLKQLIDQIKIAGDIREDLPALIIDDESDQASVNTRAKASIDGERTKTNGVIVRLLELLPRAHYVGYTATPFANVFVDPDDAADIFPRDFIISLNRPDGYMGVAEFHDLEGPRPGAISNREAHVRQFVDESREASLEKAVDAFFVGGALKLFRASHGAAIDTNHHTMLVHETVANDDQSLLKDRLLELWHGAGYGSPGPGLARLEKEFRSEFAPVSKAQAGDLPFPADFEELRPFLSDARNRIESGEGPVLIVNGRPESDDPRFDSRSVWKIIVGGAKLSRGYTVEGLTTTFFSRKSKQQDTLLQMGRWFGFRAGYKDLVRLFIEKSDAGEFDLYEAFEAVCRDEEMFRGQLKQYSHALKPSQVPALVYNSYPKLRPTAKNKMFNAELVSAGFVGWKESGRRSLATVDVRENWRLLEKLIQEHEAKLEGSVAGVGPGFACSRQRLVEFLDKFRWHAAQSWHAERRFLREEQLAERNWFVVFPLLKDRPLKVGKLQFSVFQRTVDDSGDFGVFSDKSHRPPLEAFAEREAVGVLSVYPTQPLAADALPQPVVGFAAYHPRINGGRVPVAFSVRSKEHAKAVVVPASPV